MIIEGIKPAQWNPYSKEHRLCESCYTMDIEMTQDKLTTLHENVGGDQPFVDLVEAFYTRLAADSLLRPLYPNNISDAKARLAMFLIQRFGGSSKYSEQRGHPRLRMRHMQWRIGLNEKQAWLTHMSAALKSVAAFDLYRDDMQKYFESTAAFLVNSTEAGDDTLL